LHGEGHTRSEGQQYSLLGSEIDGLQGASSKLRGSDGQRKELPASHVPARQEAEAEDRHHMPFHPRIVGVLVSHVNEVLNGNLTILDGEWEAIAELFSEMDGDGSGKITVDEFSEYVNENVWLLDCVERHHLTVDGLFGQLDQSDNGQITLMEFVKAMKCGVEEEKAREESNRAQASALAEAESQRRKAEAAQRYKDAEAERAKEKNEAEEKRVCDLAKKLAAEKQEAASLEAIKRRDKMEREREEDERILAARMNAVKEKHEKASANREKALKERDERMRAETAERLVAQEAAQIAKDEAEVAKVDRTRHKIALEAAQLQAQLDGMTPTQRRIHLERLDQETKRSERPSSVRAKPSFSRVPTPMGTANYH
jgi:chemotaxis protein histidine kinase CheA